MFPNARGANARIVTTDKDMAQLVREDGRAHMWDMKRECEVDAAGVREKFGVDPDQITDYLGLIGDTVDNLPGVPGVGPKGAAAALNIGDEGCEKVPNCKPGRDQGHCPCVECKYSSHAGSVLIELLGAAGPRAK